MNPTIRFVLTLFLGWTGIHRFLDRKIGTGILYLCTFGLFGIGWFVDVCIALFRLFVSPKSAPVTQTSPPEHQVSYERSNANKAIISTTSNETKSTCRISHSAFAPITAKKLEGIRSYVVLDTETTGLDRKNDRIVEISLALYEDGVQTDHYTTLVNPQIPIPPTASQVNHITDADVATAPVFSQIWPNVYRIMRGRLIVGHNVTYDLDMIGYNISDAIDSFDVEYLDTLTLSKKAFPGRDNYKLASLAKDLGISSTQTHRAYDDIMLTAQLFERCRSEIINNHRRKNTPGRAAHEKAYHATRVSANTSKTNALLALVKEVCADGLVTEDEVGHLRAWIDEHQELAKEFPYALIQSSIEESLRDNILEPQELKQLFRTFCYLLDPLGSIFPCENVDFTNKIVCLSGNFDYGTKEEVEKLLESMGATIHPRVIGKLNYLLVGNQASQEWSFGQYGQKIKQAIQLQMKGKPVKILKESDLMAAIQKSSIK